MGRDFEVNRVRSKGGSRLSSHQKLENQSHGSKSGPTEKEEGVEYMVEECHERVVGEKHETLGEHKMFLGARAHKPKRLIIKEHKRDRKNSEQVF